MRAGIVLLEGLKSWDPASVGPFKLLGVLGNGGFGRVYLGQAQNGQRVAVKVIKPDLAEDPEFRARFSREVDAARMVGGTFTARVVDADAASEELSLATEYISGPTLREAVTDQGPLAESSVLSLAAGLAEALGAIHAAGLVHRDLKPDNVLLAYDGPRVIDFGIARVAGASTLTGTGVLMGTLAYMSPEQAIGQSVGPPSDVFSLASVLVFAATGRGPYGDGTQAELLYRVAHQVPSLDDVPPQVRALVEPCMAAEPERRPTTGDLIEHLGGARPAVGWLRTETIAAIGPDDTASMTAQQPQVGRPSGAERPVRVGPDLGVWQPLGVGPDVGVRPPVGCGPHLGVRRPVRAGPSVRPAAGVRPAASFPQVPAADRRHRGGRGRGDRPRRRPRRHPARRSPRGRRHLVGRAADRYRRRPDLGLVRVAGLLRRGRFRRERLHLLGRLVVRAPGTSAATGCRGCPARRPASALPPAPAASCTRTRAASGRRRPSYSATTANPPT